MMAYEHEHCGPFAPSSGLIVGELPGGTRGYMEQLKWASE